MHPTSLEITRNGVFAMKMEDNGRVGMDGAAANQIPHMYHCHRLEHEDRSMMGLFTAT